MYLIAHRGFWQIETEKNTETAFRRALEHGFGIETDFRDCSGKIVISHDPPTGNEMTAEDFFKCYNEYNSNACLALNIKADGLQQKMMRLINEYHITNYFVFDMSVCDTLGYIEHKFEVFSRISEYEHELPFLSKSSGLWYDMFYPVIFNDQEVVSYLAQQKKICIVSPELHNQEYKKLWDQYKKINNHNIMLCTDRPLEADIFFNGVQNEQ